MALIINSGYKSLNLYFTEPSNTYYIDDSTTSGTAQAAATNPRTDIDKLYIWVGTTANFVASDDNLVYSDSFQSNIIIDRYKYYNSNLNSYYEVELDDDTNYYVRYAITSKLEPDIKVIIPAANLSASSGSSRDIKSETAGNLSPWIIKTSNYTAESGERIIANTEAGSFTITLPANPISGTSVTITDGWNFAINNLTLARNGSLIVGETKDILLDVLNTTFEFIYTGAVRGWDFTATTGPKGDEGESAPLLKLDTTSLSFAYDTSTSLEATTPNDITITATKQNIVGTVVFEAKAYSSNNVLLGDVTLTGSGDTRTLTATNFNTISGVSDRLSIRYIKVTATITAGALVLTDTSTINRVDNGSDSVIHEMVNESHTVPANSSGTVSSYSGASTRGSIRKGSVNETMNWTITKSDGSGITTNLVTPIKISTTGTIGNIIGTGPWTATITNLSSTSGLSVGNTISAIENASGRLFSGTPTSVVVASIINSTSLTYTVTGGGSPVAGDIGGLAKGENNYLLTATNLTDATSTASTTVTATSGTNVYSRTFSLSKSRDGSTPAIIDLTNDNVNIATDSTGANGDYSLASSTITLYSGIVNLLPSVSLLTITPSAGVTFSYTKNLSSTVSNLTTSSTVSLTPAVTNLSIAFINLSNVDNGKLTVSATYAGVVYSVEFTASKTRGGAGGDPATVYSIEADSEIIYNPNTQTFSPATVTYYAYTKTGNTLKTGYTNANSKIRLEHSTNNSAWTTLGSDLNLTSVSSRTLTTNTLPSTAKYVRASLIITANGTDSILDIEKDTINIDGSNSSVVTVDVENDTHDIPFTAAGVGTYTLSGTKIQVFDNTTELQYTTSSSPAAGEWTFTAVTATNITASFSIGSKPSVVSGQKYAQVLDHNSIIADTASITYTITAVSLRGVTVPGLLANQTFAKLQRTGIFRIVGATPITKSKSGVFSNITVKGQRIDGTTVSDYGVLTQQLLPGGAESSKSVGSSIVIAPTNNSSATSVLIKLYSDSSSSTVLDQSEIKVVPEGSDATIILVDVANDTHDIPADSSGTPSTYQYSGSVIQVFANTTELQYVASNATLADNQWKIATATGTGITAATIPAPVGGQLYATFPDHSNMTTDTARVDYTIQAKPLGVSTVSGLLGSQTFTKVKRTAVYRLINVGTIVVSKTGTVNQVIVNAQKIDGTTITSPFGYITETLDNGAESARVQLTSSGYTTQAVTTTQNVTIKLYEAASGGSVLDQAVLKVSRDGIDSKIVTVDVENDTHDIPANSAGTPITYQYSGTIIQVFENTTELAYTQNLLTTDLGKWTVTAVSAQGITSSINNTASNKPAAVSGQNYLVVPDHSSMASNTASITYTISARTTSGTLVTGILANQTFAKINRTGVYRLIGAAPISVSASGSVNQITLNGQLVDGSTVTNPAGWLTETKGGVESSPRVQSLTTSAANTTSSVIIKLYDAQTGGNKVDEAELKVVKEGLSGQSVDIVFTRIAAGTTPTITSNANPPTGNTTWSTSPPSGGNPLWASTGYSTNPYTTWTWDTPVKVTGESVVEVTAYKRSNASSELTPSGGSYNFSTKTLNPPTGWFATIPAGTDPIWESTAYVTDAAPSSLAWSAAVRTTISARNLDISGIVSVKFETNSSATNRFNPTSINLSAVTSNLIGTVTYSWSTSSTGVTLTNSTSSTVTVSFSGTDTSTKTIQLSATDSIGTLTKTISIPVVSDAPSTVALVYSNDSHVVPTTGGTNWLGSGGQIKVFEGTSLLFLNSTIPTASYPATRGRYNLAITKISGDTLTVGSLNGTTEITLTPWSGTLTQQTVYRITAYIRTNGDQTVTVSTDATITPSKDSILYYLDVNPTAIAKANTGNVFSPDYLSIKLYRSIGGATPSLYSGRFNISYTTDGTNFTAGTAYTSSADENTRTHVIPTNINNLQAVRIRAFLAGGTSVQLDEEIVTVVNQGAPGASAKGLDVNSNGGSIKKTGTVYNPSTVTIQALPQNLTSPTYSWSVSGGTPTTASTQSITITPTSSTNIVATVTATEPSTGTTYQKTVTFVVASDGIGTDGKRTASGYVYYQTASNTAPAKPTATSYQFTTSTFSGLTGGWSNTAPIYSPTNGNNYWAVTYSAVENTALSNSSSGANLTFGTVQQTIGFSGLVTFSSLSTSGQTAINGANITTGLIIAERIDSRGLTIKDVNGNIIFGSGMAPIPWTNISSTDYPTALSNSAITVDSNGQITGIGTGSGTTVANNNITINNSGQITGIGTGSNTTVSNSSISINASTGELSGIGTGNSTIVANSKVSLSASTGNLSLNNGVTTTSIPLSNAGISAMAYIAKITTSNAATYMANGIITNAFIGNIIASTNFDGTFGLSTGGTTAGSDSNNANLNGNITTDGTVGWAIGKSGKAVFNNITVRGKISTTDTASTRVEIGSNVGSSTNHHGLTLSSSDYDNVFLRRINAAGYTVGGVAKPTTVFFRVGNPNAVNGVGIDYDTDYNILTVAGKIKVRELEADRIITTGMVVNNAVSTIYTSEFWTDGTWSPGQTYSVDLPNQLTISGVPTGESVKLVGFLTGNLYPNNTTGITATVQLKIRGTTAGNTSSRLIGEAGMTVRGDGISFALSGALSSGFINDNYIVSATLQVNGTKYLSIPHKATIFVAKR